MLRNMYSRYTWARALYRFNEAAALMLRNIAGVTARVSSMDKGFNEAAALMLRNITTYKMK